jgi:hypothetical protein
LRVAGRGRHLEHEGIRDMQQLQILCEFIRVLFISFLAKARKILDFRFTQRDLNPIASAANGQKPNRSSFLNAIRILMAEKDMGKQKGGRDVQKTQFLCRFTIKLLLFLAKVRKILDFLRKHRDLNPIESKSNCQKLLSIRLAF